MAACNNSGWTDEDYEIIIVNDGSKDNTLKKVCEIRDSKGINNIIIVDKENGGVSSARNAGIDASSGKWIWFVDPDDQLSVGKIDEVWGSLSNDIDMLSFGYELVNSEKSTTHIMPFVLSDVGKNRYLNQKELLKEYTPYLLGYSQENIDRLYRGLPISDKEIFVAGAVWHYLFRRDIVIQNNVRFDEDVILKEDALFVIDYMSNINNALFVSDCWYKYRVNTDGGLASNLRNAEKLIKNKIALAVERARLAMIYKKKLNVDIKPFFVGSNVLSVAEISIKASKNGFKLQPLYMKYVKIKEVKHAIQKISITGAPLKYRIPFVMMKCNLYRILYLLFWIAQKCGFEIFGRNSLFK